MTDRTWSTKIKIIISVCACLVVGFLSIYSIRSFVYRQMTPAIVASATSHINPVYDFPTSPAIGEIESAKEVEASVPAIELPKLAPKKHIEVNLSDQKMLAMEDDQVVRESFITSGRDGYPTVTGDFAIYLKQRNTRLRSPFPELSYDFPVRFWMPFYSGYGIHDAYWRSEFGGQDYHWAGSHGCLNTPDDMVEFIWDWSEVGTPVHVGY
jgi:lipoprotein-anchoring transpeptidase ErfK/SrfK